MDWDKLRIKHFLSIEEAVIDLNNRGLVLVEGRNKTSTKFKSNGSGKTSIFEAIVYALYDTTVKGLKADEVINNKLPKRTNCEVILEGHDGDDQYIIERYRKSTKHKNKVRLICNGQDISEKSTADTNKKIQQLVGMDYNTFVNSILFSQGNGAGRFAVATDKEKKEILDNVVKLEIYGTAQNIAKDKVKAKEAEIVEKKREGERLQWELAQVDTLEQQDKQNYEATKHLIIKTQVDLKAAQAEHVTYRDGNAIIVEQSKAKIAELEYKRDHMATADLSSERANVDQLRNGIQRVQGEIDKLGYKKAELVGNYKKIELNTNCPVCGSPLDAQHREQELTAIKGQLRDVLMQTKVLQGQLEPVQTAYDNALADLQAKQEAVSSVNTEYRQVLQAIENQKQIINQYHNNVQMMQNKVDSIQRTLEGLQGVTEPTNREADRNTLKEKMKAQKLALLALEKEKSALEDVVKVYSNAGVKSHILDLVTPFLNTQGNTYLNALAGSDMELIFSTQTQNKNGEMSEKFDVKLLNANGGDEYQGNSEGEKKRADLSISLALKDFVKGRAATNFELYDEVFDALDEVGAENVITLLKERLKTVGTIFVVTHSEHLKPLFEQNMVIIKEKNGISSVYGGEKTS